MKRARTVLLAAVIAMAACQRPHRVNIARRSSSPTASGTITVDVAASVNSFSPVRSLGAALDGLSQGEVDRAYRPDTIARMKESGLGAISYRVRTELGIEVWHWNERGQWSDPSRHQGYWVSSDQADGTVAVGRGYRLPRRGNTIDQANNDGYSRLDDGDLESFWKSNPYLDQHYTHEANSLHPQWVLVDLLKRKPMNAVRIAWGEPYATNYHIEYREGPDPSSPTGNAPGGWRAFPNAAVTDGKGGDVLLRLSNAPVSVRYLRIMLLSSSQTARSNSTDIRDRLGYAIREIYVGTLEEGQFRDLVQHGRGRDQQTLTFASSTDPWHRASDLDPNVEQPSFDLVMKSGITRGLPMMVPVGVLYDTPENATAELRFLRSRGYPVTQIEMGEEPDGQYVVPEDYGALYLQWADALRQVDRKVQLGGPGFQTDIGGWVAWPDAAGNRSWMNRFLAYLRHRHRLPDFNFFTFEWYPFDLDAVCQPTAPQLARAPEMLRASLESLDRDGVPRTIPWIITEYGYSAFSAPAELDVPGALLNAEIAAMFLSEGGRAAYLYGYQPGLPARDPEAGCDAWGNLMMFLWDADGKISATLPTFYGAEMLAREWVQPVDKPHRLYSAVSNVTNGVGQSLVTAFAVYRPDGRWALLILNKDPQRTHLVMVQFREAAAGLVPMQGPLDLVQYSPAQYHWQANGRAGRPTRSDPPERWATRGTAPQPIQLPPYSLTVARTANPRLPAPIN